jgi:hypothetical protein
LAVKFSQPTWMHFALHERRRRRRPRAATIRCDACAATRAPAAAWLAPRPWSPADATSATLWRSWGHLSTPGPGRPGSLIAPSRRYRYPSAAAASRGRPCCCMVQVSCSSAPVPPPRACVHRRLPRRLCATTAALRQEFQGASLLPARERTHWSLLLVYQELLAPDDSSCHCFSSTSAARAARAARPALHLGPPLPRMDASL